LGGAAFRKKNHGEGKKDNREESTTAKEKSASERRPNQYIQYLYSGGVGETSSGTNNGSAFGKKARETQRTLRAIIVGQVGKYATGLSPAITYWREIDPLKER